MKPVFGKTLEKREAFSVNLRKKKRQEILSHKRGKILQSIKANSVVNDLTLTDDERKMLIEMNMNAL